MNDIEFQEKVLRSLTKLETHLEVILGSPGRIGTIPQLQEDVKELQVTTGDLVQTKGKVLMLGAVLMLGFQSFLSWLFRGK